MEPGIGVEAFVLRAQQVKQVECAIAAEALVVPLDHEERGTLYARSVRPVAIAKAPADGAGPGQPAQA